MGDWDMAPHRPPRSHRPREGCGGCGGQGRGAGNPDRKGRGGGLRCGGACAANAYKNNTCTELEDTTCDYCNRTGNGRQLNARMKEPLTKTSKHGIIALSKHLCGGFTDCR